MEGCGRWWTQSTKCSTVLSKKKKEPELPEGIMALPLLQMAYRGKVKLTPQQARCAIEALPYETPKLSAVAHGHFDGTDFASRLERAIERSKSPLALNAPASTIEHDPAELKTSHQRYRRY